MIKKLDFLVYNNCEHFYIDEEWEILQPVFDEIEAYTTGCP